MFQIVHSYSVHLTQASKWNSCRWCAISQTAELHIPWTNYVLSVLHNIWCHFTRPVRSWKLVSSDSAVDEC